jgi:hypothetical protein
MPNESGTDGGDGADSDEGGSGALDDIACCEGQCRSDLFGIPTAISAPKVEVTSYSLPLLRMINGRFLLCSRHSFTCMSRFLTRHSSMANYQHQDPNSQATCDIHDGDALCYKSVKAGRGGKKREEALWGIMRRRHTCPYFRPPAQCTPSRATYLLPARHVDEAPR